MWCFPPEMFQSTGKLRHVLLLPPSHRFFLLFPNIPIWWKVCDFFTLSSYTEFNDNELEPQNISHGNLTKLAALDHSLIVQIFLSGGILNGWFPSPL